MRTPPKRCGRRSSPPRVCPRSHPPPLTVEAAARAAWVATGEAPRLRRSRARIEVLTGELAVATAALEHERRLAASDTALAETRARIEEFETLLARIDAAPKGLPGAPGAAGSRTAATCRRRGCTRVGRGPARRGDDAVSRAAREAERLAAAQRDAESVHAAALAGARACCGGGHRPASASTGRPCRRARGGARRG